ncbi:MAG TPA: DUF6266 family protein, partial [Dysgonamonadaceae bacterium]|nr:DUF6266 family protein [Dysgonamonadaceae bacterium]
NPQTLKQQANRMKFRFVNLSLTPLRQVIKRGYLDTQAFPKVCSRVLKMAVEGEYPNFTIDFSKLPLADGILQPVEMITTETRKNTSEVIVKWEIAPEKQTLQENADDKVSLVFFDEVTRSCFFHENIGSRSDQMVTVLLSEANKDNPLHYWVYLSASNGNINSPSVYIGQLKW